MAATCDSAAIVAAAETISAAAAAAAATTTDRRKLETDAGSDGERYEKAHAHGDDDGDERVTQITDYAEY